MSLRSVPLLQLHNSGSERLVDTLLASRALHLGLSLNYANLSNTRLRGLQASEINW
jgi:hypothetical protein